jgi:hypothetical protein
MAANTNNWSDLLDVVLFEANRVTLPRRIKHATEAIHKRMEELLNEGNVDSISERLALSNALATLADLQKIAFARKPSQSIRHESGQATGGRF